MLRPWIGLCVLVVVVGSVGSAQVTTRLSVTTAGAQGNNISSAAVTSADGRFVAFASSASNLVPGDSNGQSDVFVRDLVNGTTERVSVGAGAVQGNDYSHYPSISADGRYVAFGSLSTNLVVSDTNARMDIFVRDRTLGTTQRVSVGAGGVQANDESTSTAISADGRYVAFESYATNLASPGGGNGTEDVYVRDRVGGTTQLVSVDSGGGGSDGRCIIPSISADGRYVAFQSDATDLVVGDTNVATDTFVRDRQLATTERVSVDSGGAQGNSFSGGASISADGRYVGFTSISINLVPGDTNGVGDAFVRDLLSGTTERVSLDSGGTQGNSDSGGTSISADGRYVVFGSNATNLVPGDTNGFGDAFLRDRLLATTERLSLSTGGAQGNSGSSATSVSADGRYVAFVSLATNLVPGDTNGWQDIFLRERNGGTDPESQGLGGVPSNGDSLNASISADGRYVAFESVATNIVAGDTNGSRDIFVRDRHTATTTRVSVATGGTEANGDSAHPSISSDGRYVTFESIATNLVAGDTNAAADAFFRDRQTGTTTRVSVGAGGAQGNGASANPSISADGSVVAFESAATNLVAGDTNGTLDVFSRDGLTTLVSTTARLSVDSTGAQGNGASGNPSTSANGQFVAFESVATNLVTGDTNVATDIFVRDVLAGATTRWSLATGGAEANGDSSNAAISGDGTHVAFQSTATNLVPGDTNLVVDVFVHRGLGTTTDRVSVDSGGTQGLGGVSTKPAISVDGRNVAFVSDASNLVVGDTNGASDVLVRDRQTGDTTRVSVDSGGTQGASSSGGPSISADGRFIVFDSFANNLVPGDTNGFEDVFLRDQGTLSAFDSFCFGDGSVAPCPCNNNGTTGRGCRNSGGTGGALLTVSGVASLTGDTVQFTSSGENPTALSIFVQGTAAIAPVPYAGGLRCAGGAIRWIFVKSAVGGVAVAPQASDLSVSARAASLNAPISLGATRVYQVYYRDRIMSWCASQPSSPSDVSSGMNASNGMIVVWGG